MKKSNFISTLFFSLLGLVASLLATRQYFQIAQFGFEQKSFCSLNEFVNCDAAYASSYAQFMGFPVSWFGVLFFSWMILATIWVFMKKDEDKNWSSLAYIGSLLSVIFSIYKAYISLAVLHVLCLLCTGIYIASLGLLVCWLWQLDWKLTQIVWIPKKYSPILLGIVLFGAGLLGMNSYQKDKLAGLRIDIKPEEMVAYHFRGSEYQMDISKDQPVWGNPNAKVTLVEFSDFQCPFCKRAAFLLKPVLGEYKDKVRFVFYNYPLDMSCNDNIKQPMHTQSCLAAYAGVCAAKQNDFWAFHDEVFRNQSSLSDAKLHEIAKDQKLDMVAFDKCLTDPATLKTVKDNIAAGNKIFVSGTPTILLDNRHLKYWMDPAVFRAILDEAIKQADAKK